MTCFCRNKLYGSKDSFRVKKVLIAAKIANIDLTLTEEKPPHNKFPIGTTPAYEDGDVLLFGAESIALHLLGNKLGQWLQWAEGSLLPNVLGYVLPSISVVQIAPKVVEATRNELFAQLKCLDEFLLTRTFLSGERLSLADITVALDLLCAFEHVLDGESRANLKNVTRWFNTIVNQPKIRDVVGQVHFAEHVEKFNMAKFKELSAKYRFVLLSFFHLLNFIFTFFSTFVMDAFKRVYSNEDTATKAIPYFWENFDAENYSIWFCEYKYPEELTLTFMSCNLISGMFQRLEKLKKNAFASMCLFGSDNNSTISGVWVWRGHELAFTLSPDWQVDYESYDWKKLDPADEKTKKLVNEYLLWEGEFGGRKFNQGKIFK
ncbi:unnamed protein product [Dracunculus medinensis]|uniref:eEF-1B gamma n=1 Tax=Dracunculus medinensis TaxID=318479 RepID=A0A0N4U4E0_DRAME|nr:unnamed protein product [Dracunculus medinensis]